MSGVRLTELSGGLRVVTDAMPGFESAAVSLYVGAGARAELPEEHGLAHLLEHMAFKGTSRRSAREIAEEIEEVGGDLNADTSYQRTGYHARVLSGDVPRALDILSDIITDPAFDPEELEREHGVIAQEIGAVEDTPDDLVFELLRETAFAGQPLGRSILGTVESVRSLGRDALSGFRERHYRRPRTIVSAAGGVDHDRLVAAASELLGGLSDGSVHEDGPAIYSGGERIVDRDLEQLHLTLGFPGRSVHDRDVYAAQMFASIVGGGMSSRLFQEVREKRGLAYSVFAFHWAFEDVGLLGLYAGTGPGSAATLVPVALDEMIGAAAGATEREVERARAQMKAGLLMGLEQPGERADHHARHLLTFGRPLDPAEIVGRIDAVTVADVRRVGREMLSGTPTLASLGAAEGVPPVGSVADRLGSLAAAA
jgi:predicted Zn-dependent peptidase